MVCCKHAAAGALFVAMTVMSCVAFLPMTPGPRLGGLSPYRIFSQHHERTASSLRESRKPLELRMGESILKDIIAKKQAKVDQLKASPPPGIEDRLKAMGTISHKSAVFKYGFHTLPEHHTSAARSGTRSAGSRSRNVACRGLCPAWWPLPLPRSPKGPAEHSRLHVAPAPRHSILIHL